MTAAAVWGMVALLMTALGSLAVIQLGLGILRRI
jgi:hypothetical protein